MARDLRVKKGLRQRQVAQLIGIAPSTYANLESSPNRVIREDRAELLAKVHGLCEAERMALMDAWRRAPLSEYALRQRDRWAARNKLRSKARNYDRMQLALVELLGLFIGFVPKPGSYCNCAFGGGTAEDPTRSCELCSALEALGFLGGFSDKDELVMRLSKMQDELEAKRFKAPPQN